MVNTVLIFFLDPAVREFLYRPPPWPATVAASCVKVVVSISFFN
jgi:hypothetical protein